MRHFTRDERGGAIAVLGFVTLAIAIVGSLAAAFLSSQQLTMRNEIARAAESSIRTTVDTVVIELNTRGFDAVKADVDAADAGYAPAAFKSTAAAIGSARITSIDRDGRDLVMHIEVASTGVIKWQRETDSRLYLAGVRNISKIGDDGTVDWEYLGGETGIDGEDLLAVWSPVSTKAGTE